MSRSKQGHLHHAAIYWLQSVPGPVLLGLGNNLSFSLLPDSRHSLERIQKGFMLVNKRGSVILADRKAFMLVSKGGSVILANRKGFMLVNKRGSVIVADGKAFVLVDQRASGHPNRQKKRIKAGLKQHLSVGLGSANQILGNFSCIAFQSITVLLISVV